MLAARLLPDTDMPPKPTVARRRFYVGAVLLAGVVAFKTLQGGLQFAVARAVAAAPSQPAANGASSTLMPRGFGWPNQPYSTQDSSHTATYGSTRDVSSKECPSWFWEYVSFHATNRGQPNAKYLITVDDRYGLGDRLNGALAMLRLAQALNRVLLLRWESPYPLEEFFKPTGVLDWTTQGIEIEDGPSLSFKDPPGWKSLTRHIQNGSLQGMDDTFIFIKTNMELHRRCQGCPNVTSQWSEEAACLWQNMFRPVEPILQQARVQLQQLYPGDVHVRPYVAVHLRLGGLEGEEGGPGYERGKSPLENFLASVRCAAKLASKSSIDLDETPALVVTDNHNLRQMLQEQHFRRIVTPEGLPVHVGKAEDQSLEAHRSTVVDMVLLGWSECLATSKSGFSLHAWLYGGAKPCRLAWKSCL
jgi:hypothetical protein